MNPKNFPTIVFLLLLFCQACEKEKTIPYQSAKFSDEYISEHKGKYFIEIPDVYELAHVVMAIEYQNSKKDYFIGKNISYFEEVLAHFNQYRDSRVFDKFDYAETDFNNNYSFRTNSYAYSLDNNYINSKEIYPAMWGSDVFTSMKNEVEDFALDSDFSSFYSGHKDFYESQISLYDSLVPVNDIWQWLEEQFSSRYDCYKILISPLTKGSHNTQRFETNKYKETIMFVSGLNREVDSFNTINIALNTRYVFTEIDHNYVNPVSDRYKNEIMNSMSDLAVWKNKNQINELYDNAYLVFNEYMTWAVYDLYISEKYPSTAFEDIREITIDKMENGRGFIKFRMFEDYLINLFKNRDGNKNIEGFYPEILEWIKENNQE